MQCHRCRNQAEVRDGKYRDVAFENTPCGKCKWRQTNSEYTLEYDDEITPASALDALLPTARTRRDALPVSVLIEAMRVLLRLRPVTRDVVLMRARGMTYAAIAHVVGTSVAAVEMRHVRALRNAPVLGALFRAKAAKDRVSPAFVEQTGLYRPSRCFPASQAPLTSAPTKPPALTAAATCATR